MLTLLHFSCWITVNDLPLMEYETKVDPYHHTVSCWIPSTAGKEFTVHWRDHGSQIGTATYISLDGVMVPGKYLWGAGVNSRSGVRTGPTTERPFVFAHVGNSKEEVHSTGKLKEAGTIVVRMKLVEVEENATRPPNPITTVSPSPVMNDASAAAGHFATFGRETKIHQQYPCTFVAKNASQNHSLVKFIFHYRPMAYLLEHEIVTRVNPYQYLGYPPNGHMPSGLVAAPRAVSGSTVVSALSGEETADVSMENETEVSSSSPKPRAEDVPLPIPLAVLATEGDAPNGKSKGKGRGKGKGRTKRKASKAHQVERPLSASAAASPSSGSDNRNNHPSEILNRLPPVASALSPFPMSSSSSSSQSLVRTPETLINSSPASSSGAPLPKIPAVGISSLRNSAEPIQFSPSLPKQPHEQHLSANGHSSPLVTGNGALQNIAVEPSKTIGAHSDVQHITTELDRMQQVLQTLAAGVPNQAAQQEMLVSMQRILEQQQKLMQLQAINQAGSPKRGRKPSQNGHTVDPAPIPDAPEPAKEPSTTNGNSASEDMDMLDKDTLMAEYQKFIESIESSGERNEFTENADTNELFDELIIHTDDA